MMPLEKLHQKINDKGVDVMYLTVTRNKKSVSFFENGYKAIGLSKPLIESDAEERVLLAEEDAHLEISALYCVQEKYNTPLHRANRRKAEIQACRYAMEKTLTARDIQEALDAICVNIQEAAEYCNVPPHYLVKALDYYISKGIAFDFNEAWYD